MRKAWLWLTIALVAAALVASSVLFVDYTRPAPVFCDGAGGCASVKATVLARPFGIPMPAFGLLGMFAIGLAALVPGRTARLVHAALGGIAGLMALVLFYVQFKIHALCPYCAVVDSASLVLCAIAVLRLKNEWDPPGDTRISSASVGVFVLAGAIPSVIGFTRPKPVSVPKGTPDIVAMEIEKTGPGKVTVIDFVDFECPFCRMNHAELGPLLDARKAKIRLVRKHVPLRMHPHALDAAKAGCCAESQNKADEMAEALFKTKPDELTPEGCEKLAQSIGLDIDKYKACLTDPATMSRIEKDKADYRAAKCDGLPTVFVGASRLEGAKEAPEIREELDKAIRAL